MPDIAHVYGGDLAVSANGDLLLTDSVDLSNQRILRRLLTNPGDYIWHPEYGAGLPKMIGMPIDVDSVKAIIVSQIFLEATVQRSPQPIITVQSFPNGMFVQITYTEADSGQTVTLSFDVNQ
jgi:hypothetical protein